MSIDRDHYAVPGVRFRSSLCLQAVLSLAAGMIGMFFCLFGSIPAVVLGHIALRRIRNSNGRLSGTPIAYVGLLLGYGQLALFAMFAGLVIIGAYTEPIESPAAATSQVQAEDVQDGAPGPAKEADASTGGNDAVLQASERIQQVLSALEAYFRDCGAFPTEDQGLAALRAAPEGASSWKGPYLPDEPLDPWSRPLAYRRSEFGIEVFSTGRDGVESDDDVR